MERLVQSQVVTNAKIALVGEAPGSQEERTGLPFVGAAGELLSRCMQKANMQRSETTITNVFKIRPNNNQVRLFLDLSKRRAQETAIYKESRDILRLELEKWKPNVVCALGAVPLYTLTGHRHIMKWRGSILESTLIPGLKVIPTAHPAAALRQYTLVYPIVWDLQRVKKESETPKIALPERTYIIEPTQVQVQEFLASIRGPVAFDIEVMREEVSCISFSYDPMVSMSIPFIDQHGGNYWSEEAERNVWYTIKEVLENPSIEKIAQNGIFDCTFLAQKCGIFTRGLVGDTMVGWAQLFPDISKGLAFISSVLTREPYYKDVLRNTKGGLG